MIWTQLYYRAYELAMRCNQHVIIHDLPLMTELELAGVISLLSRVQGAS